MSANLSSVITMLGLDDIINIKWNLKKFLKTVRSYRSNWIMRTEHLKD